MNLPDDLARIAAALERIAAALESKPTERPASALLGVEDVTAMLGVGDRMAREVMLRLTHVRIGKLLKIRPEVLAKWLKSGGDQYLVDRDRVEPQAETAPPTESIGAADKFAALRARAKANKEARTEGEKLSMPVQKRVPKAKLEPLRPRVGHGRNSRLR